MSDLLEARGIRVEFGPLVAVDDVSFRLEGGQLLGLIGPNGAGKTTLLRALCGLQAPTRGMALVMGEHVLSPSANVRYRTSFAPDSPPAYEELTVDQFLGFIAASYGLDRSEAEERIAFWLEQLWLVDKRQSLIRTLSRGMRQRVTLARTFIPGPSVILLDEPLTGLDPAGRIHLRGVLGMLRDQGCALIVSSHILTDLEAVSTHIAILEHGKLLRWNTAESLHHHTAERRIYRISVLPDSRDPAQVLAGIAGVSNIQRDGSAFLAEADSGDAQAAELLRALLAADLKVTSFSPVRASLEEVYLRAGVRQVD